MFVQAAPFYEGPFWLVQVLSLCAILVSLPPCTLSAVQRSRPSQTQTRESTMITCVNGECSVMTDATNTGGSFDFGDGNDLTGNDMAGNQLEDLLTAAIQNQPPTINFGPGIISGSGSGFKPVFGSGTQPNFDFKPVFGSGSIPNFDFGTGVGAGPQQDSDDEPQTSSEDDPDPIPEPDRPSTGGGSVSQGGLLTDDDFRTSSSGGVDINIAEVISHNQFSESDIVYNDISLLRLENAATLNDYIQPICIAASSKFGPVGEDVLIAGWGKTETGQVSLSLREAIVPVIEESQCQRSYGPNIDSRVVCAGGKGHDTCQGDSGGPLVSVRGSKHYLVGIVSFGGKKCGDPNYPGVYTRVSSFKDWVADRWDGS